MVRQEKRKLAKTARTPSDIRDQHPMYQFAVHEFSHTVQPNQPGLDAHPPASYSIYEDDIALAAPSALPGSRSLSTAPYNASSTNINMNHANPTSTSVLGAPALSTSHTATENNLSTANSTESGSVPAYHRSRRHPLPHVVLSSQPTTEQLSFRAGIPDAMYEETYGEAYVGGHIRYIYPSGYGALRPRSFPWKLSIIASVFFMWLSIFVVGHCADQAEIDSSAAADGDAFYEDDMDVKWCGSRKIYLLWVLCAIITGLSAAYCLLIGYIKVRDFTVANSRSQPPGVIDTKSDYYVKIDDVERNRSIYQSDGTPQFWGGHIYRPTQAAVAITNR